MKNSNFLFVIFTICILFSNISFSQNSYSSAIKFNLPVDGKMINQGGLEVKCSLLPTRTVSLQQATLDQEPERYLNKRIFILFITITNTGLNDVVISDWHFQAICPENLHGQQWQETSFINLIVPYIPSSANILLKPGEKKSFNTGETDFFWCTPKHEMSLMTPPCGITGIIVCYQIGNPIFSNGNQSGFYGNNCRYIDYDNLPKTDNFTNTGKSGNSNSSTNSGGTGSSGLSGVGQKQPESDSKEKWRKNIPGSSLLATHKDEKGQWGAIGPYESAGGFATEQAAIESLLYTNADLTLVNDKGKFKIYTLNLKAEHDARDVREILKKLGAENIPD